MMIRGVNLGGWLVLERYITPYQFAITDCHLVGNFCWYPNQLSAPPVDDPMYQLCSLNNNNHNDNIDMIPLQDVSSSTIENNHSRSKQQPYCTPVRIENAFGNVDYPLDEKTLVQAFLQHNTTTTTTSTRAATTSTTFTYEQRYHIAEKWFNYHFEHFITQSDLIRIQQSNITHVRVPIPHWILGNDVRTEAPYHEVWMIGQRWKYFLRLCHWARELGLYVWPDIHTAPGSQNGFGRKKNTFISLFFLYVSKTYSRSLLNYLLGFFWFAFRIDNSGEALPYNTCQVWSNNPENVNRSLFAIRTIVEAIVDAKITDVITGFGLLNEPFADCVSSHYRTFVQDGMKIVRTVLGPNVAIYVSDMFQADIFNDGHWWIDPKRYKNTFLDSHYYQVFDQPTRHLSPRQHIAYACTNHHRRTTSCCYKDGPHNNHIPSSGVARMIGEWSASFDILPAARINDVMDGIATTGIAPYFDRQLSFERQEFLRNYIQAQIVTFESVDVGVTKAWFYWTMKMEGGAFAEWDFLRGVQEGWFPSIPGPNISSESIYGNCFDIMGRTNDNRTAILEEYPDPMYLLPETDMNKIIDDDIVLSHGDSLLHYSSTSNNENDHNVYATLSVRQFISQLIRRHWLALIGMVGITLIVILRKRVQQSCKRRKYYPLESEISMTI
jgi:glucan 1,3-beta-glucosidase